MRRKIDIDTAIHPLKRWVQVALLLSAIPAVMLGQTQTPGQIEIAAFGGGSYLQSAGEGHTKAAFGGRVGAAASQRVFVFGEFSYYPMASISAMRAVRGCPQSICPGGPASYGVMQEMHMSAGLWDFSGGVHVNLRRSDSKVAPYVLGTLGAGRASADGSFSVKTGTTLNQTHVDASQTALGTGAGIGLRAYVGKNWGFQPELRYTRYFFEDAGLNNVRFTVGLFYRFGK